MLLFDASALFVMLSICFVAAVIVGIGVVSYVLDAVVVIVVVVAITVVVYWWCWRWWLLL